jgi:minor histocompatibility antigen H13
MLTRHTSNYIAIGILLAMTFIRLIVPIHPAIMTAVSTCLLVYVGCTFSTKICFISGDKTKEGIETMKQKDAWLFPVIGSAVLLGLYLLFKFFNEKYLNILLHIYFTLLGSFSIGQLIEEKIIDKEPFKSFGEQVLLTIPKIPYFNPEGSKVNKLNIITFAFGSIIGLLYFAKKNWILNNILGMAFSIFGIENLMLGEYKVGLILLSLLFFYDIFWVFYTPVMVSVAKNIEGPVKLMFPKLQAAIDLIKKEKGENNEYAGKAYDPREYNMIGLGDIVVPGVYVALMLRFDIYLFKKAKNDISQFGYSFKNMKYFFITFIFYNLGIIITLSSMYFFNHAQPALLYLVPCTLISSSLLALQQKDFTLLWQFNEEQLDKDKDKDKKDEDDDDDDDGDTKKKTKEKGETEDKKKKVE